MILKIVQVNLDDSESCENKILIDMKEAMVPKELAGPDGNLSCPFQN